MALSRKQRILIVEDEAAIRSGLEDVLVFHGFEVASAADGTDGLAQALSGQHDLVLLDVMLPGLDGFSILERVREADRDLAIILLTARSGDDEIIHGLRLGADDYVAKPFSVAQLVLRIQAVLRRTLPDAGNPSRFDIGEDLEIDSESLSGRRGDEVIAFTRREMDVLVYLNGRRGQVVSRDELLNKVWGYDRGLELETRTVDIHIGKLRRKIESDAAAPRWLVTVRGAGYRLEAQ